MTASTWSPGPAGVPISSGFPYKSVLDAGAIGNGVFNCTAAFTATRALTGGKYWIPNGTYVLDAAPDPFLDLFKAGDNVTLIVGGVAYVVSNAFAGPWKWVAASATKLNMVHAKSGNTIMYVQDGGPGTATGFFRGLAFTTDSHCIQAQPATNGGSTDILFQRSTLNVDPAGNRFNITFNEALDRLDFSMATTASGAPAFDTCMSITAGIAPVLAFPAVIIAANQGIQIQTRAGGALKLLLAPLSATLASFKDVTSGNTLYTADRSKMVFSGIAFNTLLDVPLYTDGPQRWGAVFGDLAAVALPVTKTLFTAVGAAKYSMIGTLRVAAAPSGAAGTWRESRFTYDGTTLTVVDLINTLPVQIVANIILTGTSVQFSGSYAGGLGGGISMSVSVEWSHTGR